MADGLAVECQRIRDYYLILTKHIILHRNPPARSKHRIDEEPSTYFGFSSSNANSAFFPLQQTIRPKTLDPERIPNVTIH